MKVIADTSSMKDTTIAKDPSSLSNVQYFKAIHLDWIIAVDFDAHILDCTAKQTFECINNGAESLLLDTSNLSITNVKVDDVDVAYKVLKTVEPFGQPLKVTLPEGKRAGGSTFEVTIQYKTSPKATAVQWLKPEQTFDKKHPYLFTQCEAIHARSLLPCIDSPSNKITYNAQISVPNELVALMSAVKGEEISSHGRKTCHFEQKVPIPSYLLAIVVGALEYRIVGPRSRVWCEASKVEACEYEFAKVEDMLSAAESIMGPYVWGQYDLVILPPSFPFGGMENPCLTFATPTVLAGDRSLTALVAHEITHSWTGNLVTNRRWQHFWLNEGFTKFIEGKIVGLLEGEQMRQFEAIRGWRALQDTINVFGATNKLTALQPELDGVDPDDAFSSVPYEKGYAFLYYIESLVGGPAVFNDFLRSYIEKFKYKTVITDDFKTYLLDYFKGKSNKLDEIDWDAWLNSPGMPTVPVIDMYDHTLATACKELCNRWANASAEDVEKFTEEDFKAFTSVQKIDFLTQLYQQEPLSLEKTQRLVEVYKLFNYNNSEIKFAMLRLCIRAQWTEVYPKVVSFLLEQGRMKFVRPLYRELYKFDASCELALRTFKENRQIYHSIADAMIAKDLKLH